MPNVIEAPESVQEERWQSPQENGQPHIELLPTPRRGLLHMLARFFAVGAACTGNHFGRSEQLAQNLRQPEMPLDMVARRYPNIFIQSM